MNETIRKWLQAFGAGCAGAMVSNFVFWLCWRAELLKMAQCHMKPGHYLHWPYRPIVLGGFFALLMLIEWGPRKALPRGLLFSLIPSLVTIVMFFPYMDYHPLGFDQGYATPFFVLGFNAIWGLVAAGLLDKGPSS